MTDRFAFSQPSLSGPAASGFAVTPDDGADLSEVTRALYVGSGGDLCVTMPDGAQLVFANVADGALLPLRVRRVLSTGTSAAAIVALV